MVKMKHGSRYSILDCYGGIESVDASYKDENFSKHVHEGYAMGIITRGVQQFFSDGKNHISGQGSLVIVNADTMHTGGPASEHGWSYRAIYPTPELINQVLADLPLGGNYAPYFTNPVIENSQLTQHLSMIFDYQDKQMPQLALESLLFSFLVKLVTQFGSRQVGIAQPNASSNLDRIKHYLDEYYNTNISLDTLAKVGQVNKYTLIRQFKQRWGLAPHQYQVQLRIQHAKWLLRQGYRPIDVASECGFYDQSHFNSHFKKALGATPRKYWSSINRDQ